jgi:hypothetical protein
MSADTVTIRTESRTRRFRRVKVVLAFLIAGQVANIIIATGFALKAESARITDLNETSSQNGFEIQLVMEATLLGSHWLRFYRSRYPAWHPMQATGPPDTPGWGDIYSAWASETQDDQDEWLQLEYETPIATVAITIHETYAPGAVRRVDGITEDEQVIELWAGIDPTPATNRIGVSRIDVAPPAPLKGVRLHLASPQVRDWNEIDAVGLVDADGEEHWATGATASTTFANLGSQFSQRNPDEMLPFQSHFDHPRLPYASGERNYEHIVQVEFGWPWPALGVEYDLADQSVGGTSTTLGVRGGIPTGRSLPQSAIAPGLEEMLPWLPRWPGLVVNMVFYGVVLSMPFLIAGLVSKYRRRRLGLCLACGYDLRGTAHELCPECGAEVRLQ